MPTPVPSPQDLTLEEKIGQLLCLGWGGPGALLRLNEQARTGVTRCRAGGMLVMGRNVQRPGKPAPPADPPAVRSMLEQLQRLARVPLLVATDQEGGRVERFREPFTRMPPAFDLGTVGDPALARAAAAVVAKELSAVGINWDFAPVADIRSDRTNAEIGDRSFGTAPDRVAAMVTAQVAGYLQGGVLPCVKHFPGLGDAATDSHKELPVVAANAGLLQTRELVPFRSALTANPPSIMVAHVLMPTVEPSGLPASLSARCITGILRGQLGYNGLVITDDLEMAAITKGWGVGRGAVLAVKAGADMVLVCHTTEAQQTAYDALLAAAKTGELPASRIDEAVGRVLAAKRRAAAAPTPPLSVIGSPAHRAVARAVRDAVAKNAAAPRLDAPPR